MSQVDELFPETYELMFSDVQKTSSLCDTISDAKAVLKGQQEVLSVCSNLHDKFSEDSCHQCGCDLLSAINILQMDIRNNYEAIVLLEQTASRIPQLVRNILYHNYTWDSHDLSSLGF